MNPRHISIAAFTYDLPDEKIARYPLEKRDASKLLVYKSGAISSSNYSNLADHLPNDAFLIFNNTKVVEARLLFKKPTGGIVEIFCLEPHDQYSDITSAMLQKGEVYWKCLVGGASKWKHGMKLEKIVEHNGSNIVVEAGIEERQNDCFVIKMTWQPKELAFAELLHAAGIIPVPPYLNREAESEDNNRYQTVYAKFDGSVAAPTAGLHFTEDVFEQLNNKGIQSTFVTLHVGAGTFKPVKSETIGDHEMHSEFIDVSADTIETIANHIAKPIVAIGTTSLRTIETLYWMGVKAHHLANDNLTRIEDLAIHQWDVYEMETSLPGSVALQSLLEWMSVNNMKRLITKTQILIAPGYQLKMASGIITNFHQPNSTLLLLIAAIVGDDWKRIYQYALDHEYRFLSYGDGSLLWANEK